MDNLRKHEVFQSCIDLQNKQNRKWNLLQTFVNHRNLHNHLVQLGLNIGWQDSFHIL